MVDWRMFIKKSGIRAIKTFFQTFASLITIDGVIGIAEIDWLRIISISAVSMIYSIATSFATGLPEIELENQIVKIMDAQMEEKEP